MDALWWFYTIVLGAAFAQIAMGMAVQWKIRAATAEPIFLPSMLWLGFLLILTIEVWIAVGYFQLTVTSMSVLSLLAFLWVPMGILVLGIFLAEPTWNGTAPGLRPKGQGENPRIRQQGSDPMGGLPLPLSRAHREAMRASAA